MSGPRRLVLPAIVAFAVAGCGSADLDRPSAGEPTGSSDPTSAPESPDPRDPDPSDPGSSDPAPSEAPPDQPKRPVIDLAGAIALDNCSGALVRFTSSRAGDPALALTAGHCYEGGFLEAAQVLVNEPSTRSMTLLDADGNDAGELRASSIVYGTMTGTDALLYELDRTYSGVRRATGVSALTLAKDQTAVGTRVSVVAGYWRRIYTCRVDSYVYRLHEADWTWRQSMQYRQPGCQTVGGTSGGPVIRHDTGEVAAINNTANVQGRRCTLNNPCEEAPNGRISVERGESYAQQSSWFYTCLTGARELDLTRQGCRLPDPA